MTIYVYIINEAQIWALNPLDDDADSEYLGSFLGLETKKAPRKPPHSKKFPKVGDVMQTTCGKIVEKIKY